MTNRQNNKIPASFAIIFFVFLFFLSVNAQSAAKAAEDLAVKLQQKVLLNSGQTEEIKSSLIEYLSTPSEDGRKNLEDKIVSVLEEKQKMKYSIIKKDWWESVSKEVKKIKKTED